MGQGEKIFSVSPLRWGVMALAALCLCSLVVADWERRLAPAAEGCSLRLQSYGAPPRPPVADLGGSRQLVEANGLITAEYGFRNFNGDRLRISFSIDSLELADYRRGYGYTQGDLDDLETWRKSAYAELYRQVRDSHLNQRQLDDHVKALGAEYRDRRRTLLHHRGFKFLADNLIAPDMPGIVARNVARVQSLALALDRTARGRGYDRDLTVGAAIAMVQTALRYEEIPREMDGRITGGLSPPLEVLALGRGDCDSKTALLASLLLNWDRAALIGVNVPGHYLMGMLQTPARGDAFVEYRGLPYVLVETSGPAWFPPGVVSEATLALMDGAPGLQIEPLAAD